MPDATRHALRAAAVESNAPHRAEYGVTNDFLVVTDVLADAHP